MTTTTADRIRRAEANFAKVKSGGAKRRPDEEDLEDREVYVERIKEYVVEQRPEVDPDEIEVFFTGVLSDAIIYIPDPEHPNKGKRAHRLPDRR